VPRSHHVVPTTIQRVLARSLPRISTMTTPRHPDLPGFGLSSRASLEKKSPLDRSESEAADALAGLAYGSRARHPRGQGGSDRPP
jgi:hypothetical protein